MAAVAVARAMGSASSSLLTARYSVTLLLSKRAFFGLSAEQSFVAGPARTSMPHADAVGEVAGWGDARINQLRLMASQSGNPASGAETGNDGHGESVKEIYQKCLNRWKLKPCLPMHGCGHLLAVVLIGKISNFFSKFCRTCGHLTLSVRLLKLFTWLQRLSNLRIHSNFNCHLCLRVTEACVRANSLDYGKKALWKHNVYGLTPSIGSAHYMLRYAKNHNDPKLMVEIMKLLRRNSLPLQAGTADIVFRDSLSIWEIEKLRSNTIKQHTVSSAFSCAKGFILERKPENAAAIINVLNENLPDEKKPTIASELQKLVSEWSLEVLKRQKKANRKVMATSLKNDIFAMIASLLNMGLEVAVNMEELKC